MTFGLMKIWVIWILASNWMIHSLNRMMYQFKEDRVCYSVNDRILFCEFRQRNKFYPKQFHHGILDGNEFSKNRIFTLSYVECNCYCYLDVCLLFVWNEFVENYNWIEMLVALNDVQPRYSRANVQRSCKSYACMKKIFLFYLKKDNSPSQYENMP